MNKYLELFKNKTEIFLRSKNINDNEVLLICEALTKNTTLKRLYLSYNKISDEGAKILTKNTTLKKLDLRRNNISDEGAKALAKNTTLENLDLTSNKISDEGAKSLAQNTTLKRLILDFNNFSDEGAKAFIKNRTLKILDLSLNKISKNIFSQIRINIENNRKRQKLSILTTNIIKSKNIEIPNYYPKILLKY